MARTYLSTYQPTYLLTYLLTYLPTYLPRKVRGGVREGARVPPHLRLRLRARAAPRSTGGGEDGPGERVRGPLRPGRRGEAGGRQSGVATRAFRVRRPYLSRCSLAFARSLAAPRATTTFRLSRAHHSFLTREFGIRVCYHSSGTIDRVRKREKPVVTSDEDISRQPTD